VRMKLITLIPGPHRLFTSVCALPDDINPIAKIMPV
jgi:hypothetical protein